MVKIVNNQVTDKLCYLQEWFFCCTFANMEEKTADKERTVVHLQLGDDHFYYGSIKSLCDNNDTETIGVTYNTLRCYGLSSEKPYSNKKCIIRKGVLIAQKGNRGKAK